jgi:hypothetical protein
MTTDQTAQANDLLQNHLARGEHINVAGQEDQYRPLVKLIREAGHHVGVGPYHEQLDGKKTRFIGLVQEESATSVKEF